MPKIVEETPTFVTFQFSCWRRNYVIRFHKRHHVGFIVFFKTTKSTDEMTVPQLMEKIYPIWERLYPQENGIDGVFKATDLTRYFKIREV